MDGRFLNGKELKCFYWDGKTNYRVVKDTNTDLQRQLDDHDTWLDSNIDDVVDQINDELDAEDEAAGDGDKTPEYID